MGNSESQYSIQGPKGTSLFIPGKHKPCSLRFCSAKEEVLSPYGWWKSSTGGQGYKSRSVGRGCLSQHKNTQPYVPRNCDYVFKGAKTNTKACQPSKNGYHQCNEKSPVKHSHNKHAMNGHRPSLGNTSTSSDGEKSSPRVVIKKDGSLRVEFTNANSSSSSSSRLGLDEWAGPVQLLRFTPHSQADTPSPSEESHNAMCTDSVFRPSKDGSLSSDGSWYDSPWSNVVELSDADNPTSPAQTDGKIMVQTLPPISLSDLYKDPNMAATFPGTKALQGQFLNVPRVHHRASFVSVLDVPSEEECMEVKQYSSYTLPCRKAKPVTAVAPESDTLKNRIRHFSDWTGSLSRKKRKVQENRSKEAIEGFDSGVDGLTADTSSPSQVSSLLWYPSAVQPLQSRSESVGALHQNIYENFMRELETERREPSVEAGEDTSSDSLGSLEQLDLLFEKEQGVVRRAGWLSFKPLITLHKDKKLELVPRRKWKQYWVTLKGCTLLFYETYRKSSSEQDLSPRYALFAEDSIVQAVPEHPKKENVFCLSNTYGDVYLFQATNQTDLENWVTAIHSASASLFAKKHGKEDTVRLLQSQTRGLLQKIDMDGKMKKMAELQLSVVSDPKNRRAIENQIQQWEQNLEKFNMDLFRVRCYLASLQGGELPNPKSLLAAASRPSKMALGRLGILSVSSFHALICSRDDATMRKRSRSVSQKMQSKRGIFSSLKGLDNLTKRGKEKRPSVMQVFESNGMRRLSQLPPSSSERLDSLANIYSVAPHEGSTWDSTSEVQVCICMPDGQFITLPVKTDHTVQNILSLSCKAKQLDPSLHGVRLCRCVGQNIEVSIPVSSDIVLDLVYDALEVFPLNTHTLCLTRPPGTTDFGFAVTGYVDSSTNSRIFVSEVLWDGVAYREGLRPGDEILVLNGKSVATFDLGVMHTPFSEQTLHLTLRHGPATMWLDSETKTTQDNRCDFQVSAADTDAPCDSLGSCPENGLHVPQHASRAEQHLKSVETVCTLYQTFQEGSEGLMEGEKDPTGPLLRPFSRHLSATERLRKVIQELVDTEKSYVKDLTCLFEIYLKPLQNETFLTLDEMESLFGSLPEMLDFQKVFLQTLEERIASSPDFSTLETPLQFKKLLFSLGGSFLYYADHFKLYSGFCANHIKVQKVLERAKTDQAFKEFLDAKNPTKQHSSTLESYLIKPVQRVLKYPLLLRELVSLTDIDSEEHYHLTEALKAMEKVASHINEMQKIYEDYGTVFDQLVAEHSGTEREVTEISMGEFLMHSSVVWLNPFPSLGRMRKDPELTMFVFKKAVILVYRESNKLKKKTTPARSNYSHGEVDPFKFRWLIPLSALQVRLGNAAGTETNCIWELIHTKSEVEGRPETIFQLCSSVPECKANIIKVIRSLLRENVRRNFEKGYRERLVPLRSTIPTSARLASSRASWLCKQPKLKVSMHRDTEKESQLDSDEGSLSCGYQAFPETKLPVAQSPDRSLKESDILSDDDEDVGGNFIQRMQRDSPIGAIEAQFQQLHLAVNERFVEQEALQEEQPRFSQAPHNVMKLKGNSLPGHQSALLSMREHSHSLDSQAEAASVDLNALLEKDFSLQSLASVVNEDCFYDTDHVTVTPSITTS